MTEKTNSQKKILISKVPVRTDLWADFKYEARRRELGRDELMEEILKKRYWDGKDQPPKNLELDEEE